MLRWRAYYPGGVTRDSSHHTWASLPDGIFGVVVFETPPYRRLVSGGDWVWMEDGVIQKSDTIWGGWVAPPDIPCRSCIKRGVAVSNQENGRLLRMMFEDRLWPF